MKISPAFCTNSGNQGTSKMWAFHNKNFYNLNFEQQQKSIFKRRGECILFLFTRVKTHNLFRAVKAALFNVLLPTLSIVVNNIEQYCWAWINPQSGVTMLNNIVDNYEQRGQHNIEQCCFQQPWTGCAFFAVYVSRFGQWSVWQKSAMFLRTLFWLALY